jgi:peptidoglycan/LPS O-acetylase OafA/YrhL
MISGKSSSPGPVVPRLGRQPALDGIRGCAVLVVVCHNFNWPGFEGGFFGVDVFFALSGFLITTLLLEDHQRLGRISLRQFFVRRFLRLYPALVVLMGFAVISAHFATRPVTFSRVALVTASVLGYWSNWMLISNPTAWTGGLQHTWSLAVEVHFYILWALVLAVVTRRRGSDLRLLGLIAASLAAASALWRALGWGLHVDGYWLYGSTDMRLDAVFLGACAGLVRWHSLVESDRSILPVLSPWQVRLLAGGAVGVLIVLITTLTKQSALPFLGGFTLAGGATAALILTALLYPGSLVARIASWPILVWLGQVSYSLYLWHVPAAKLFSASRLAGLGLPPMLGEVVRLAASLAIAAVSYYTIERYFIRLKERLQVKQQAGGDG